MKTLVAAILGWFAFAVTAHAEVAPVVVRVPETKAWIGQRVALYVDLRAPGSFEGSASFDLPQLPGTLLMKIGNPVVSSQEIDGETWFVQTHEFALFSQKAGLLAVPAFPVRFARREGFTGAVTDVRAQAQVESIEIQRPPGSDRIGFLTTTESLEVSESWDPLPGATQVGAVFKRSIIQRAQNLTGMALAPAPTNAPDGFRVYPDKTETQDKFERGDFLGERRETIIYLIQKSGSLMLPALAYQSWNPTTEELQSTILPAVTFEVAPPAAASTPVNASTLRRTWPWLLVAALVLGLGVWQGWRLAGWGRRCWQSLNPPHRVAARKLLRACRQHDAAAAAIAWNAWRNTQADSFAPDAALRAAVLGLQRQRFGPVPEAQWQGDDLARALREILVIAKAQSSQVSASALPPLNA